MDLKEKHETDLSIKIKLEKENNGIYSKSDTEERCEKVAVIPRRDIEERRRTLMTKIEEIVDHFVDCLARDEKPYLTFNDGKNSGWSSNSNNSSESMGVENVETYENNTSEISSHDSHSSNEKNSNSEGSSINSGKTKSSESSETSNSNSEKIQGSDSTSDDHESNNSEKQSTEELNSKSSEIYHDSFDFNSMMECEPIGSTSTHTDAVAGPSTNTESNTSERLKTIRFAGIACRKRFAIIMSVMSYVYAKLNKNVRSDSEDFYCTKRAFYYSLKNKDVKRFVKKQEQVDKAINEVTLILDCGPWEIGFISTSKGLVAGNLTLHFGDTKIISYEATSCQAVPDVIPNVTKIQTSADYILVVEKDSVFQRLLREGCPGYNNCILITGKGYPDIATRMLIRLLSEETDLPVYAFVDPNPHGFEIMCVYRFGTLNNLGYREQLLCPKMRWLGVHYIDLVRLGIPRVKLTDRDLKKIEDLQNRSYIGPDFMKHLKELKLGKAEIESVDKPLKYFLSRFIIPNKIRMKEYY